MQANHNNMPAVSGCSINSSKINKVEKEMNKKKREKKKSAENIHQKTNKRQNFSLVWDFVVVVATNTFTVVCFSF